MWDYLVKKVRPRSGRGETGDLHPVHEPVQSGSSGRVESGSGENRPAANPGRGVAGPRGERKLHCPVCGTAMRIEYIGSVEIDRCPDCRGIFLDKGELQKIKGRDYSRYEKSEVDHESLIYTPHGLTDHVSGRD